MAINDKNIGSNFTTGGDLIFHRIQLIIANMIRLLLVAGTVFTITFWATMHFFVSNATWHNWLVYLTSKVFCWVRFLENREFTFMLNDGTVATASAYKITKFVAETAWVQESFAQVYFFTGLALLAGGASIAFLFTLNIKFGIKAQEDDFLRGQKLVDPKLLKKLIKNPSPISIGGVHIQIELLFRNLLAIGSMGTGKSQAIFQIVADMMGWGKKMVIYDKTGELTQKFYRPGKDILLNPLDSRCADWSIFADLRKVTDPALVSRFFVPENKKSSDPVWDNASRMLLEDIITITRSQGGTMADVAKTITQSSLPDLFALLEKHKAPSMGIINPANEKTSESTRMTLTAQPAIRFFSFFDDKHSSFSIRDFIRRDDDACLFLVSNSTQHEAIKPFISAWIELALAEAMSMPPTTDVRLVFVLDELASLSKLKALDVAFTEARKYGICSIVGIQNLSQLDEIYGEDMTKVFVANLQNKLILRTEEEASARRLADTLGKEEVDEVNENKSFGVESSRDGVSLGSKRTERHLVTPSEIMILPDLTGYLKIAGAHPIAQVKIDYKSRKDHELGYIERDGLDLPAVTDQSEVVSVAPTLPTMPAPAPTEEDDSSGVTMTEITSENMDEILAEATRPSPFGKTSTQEFDPIEEAVKEENRSAPSNDIQI